MERVNRIVQHEDYRYALTRMASLEKYRRFCRHDMEHFLSVARLMLLLADREGLPPETDLFYAAALLHDIGRTAQYENGIAHTDASARLAEAILPACGYNESETVRLSLAIRAHNSKVDTNDRLTRLLQQADHLSRNCFCCPAQEDCYWPETRRNKGVTL